MSALAGVGWRSRPSMQAPAMPLPQRAEELGVKNRIRIVRDTLLVLAIQIVFRTTLVLRRWNY